MQTEQQAQPVTAPEIAPVGESTPTKKQHGGKRPGAGRKPDLVKRMIGRLSPATARDVLANVDVEKVIREIFTKGSLTLKQRTLADLWDRAYGRPAQALSVSGAVVHAHWTPGKYSHISDEDWARYAELSLKVLGPPASNASPDASGFQKESNSRIEEPAIEESAKEAHFEATEHA